MIFATSTKDRPETSVLPWVTFGHSSGPERLSLIADIHLSCKENQDTHTDMYIPSQQSNSRHRHPCSNALT